MILSPEHHAIHHHSPYEIHCCITTGWMNPLLRATDFHGRAERFISAVTGAAPRASELGGTDRRRIDQALQ